MDNTGTARPGDDMQLRFSLADYTGFADTVSEGDFMAVYDKSLLEMAKLYCDENSGILPWTNFFNDEEVSDAVAYSLGCADSIEHFNADLLEQRDAIQSWYSDDNALWVPVINPNPHPEWSDWNLTTAPEDNWDSYMKGLYNDVTELYDPLVIDGIAYYPFVPGFSSWRHTDNGGPGYRGIDTGYSAGVDCVGFIQRLITDLNTNYLDSFNVNVNRLQWGESTPNLIGNAGFRSNDYTWLLDNINLLVPGDIIAGPGHVAMVLRIEFTDDGTRTILADTSENPPIPGLGVIMIEAAWGDNREFRVTDYRRWSQLGNPETYQARRLIME